MGVMALELAAGHAPQRAALGAAEASELADKLGRDLADRARDGDVGLGHPRCDAGGREAELDGPRGDGGAQVRRVVAEGLGDGGGETGSGAQAGAAVADVQCLGQQLELVDRRGGFAPPGVGVHPPTVPRLPGPWGLSIPDTPHGANA